MAISSDRGCQAAKPGPDGKCLDHVIKGQPGLRLRVTGTKKTWSFLYRADGKRVRIALGVYPGMPLSAAISEAGKLRNKIVGGGDPARDRRSTKDALTVERLARMWLTRHAEPNLKNAGEQRRILEKDILPRLGSLRADAVTKRDVIMTGDAVLERGAPVMANRVVALVSSVFSWGVGEDLIAANPAFKVRKRAPEKSRERKLSDDELRRFWTGLDGIGLRGDICDILRLCLLLGQRMNEVAMARKAEFDLAAGVWTIPAERCKNGHEHRLPLPPHALSILEALFQRGHNSAFVFQSPAKQDDAPMGKWSVTRAWRLKRDRLGLDLHVHDLRRSFASIAGDAGFADFEIGLVLNHTGGRSSVTAVYNRARYDAEKRRVLEAVERHVLEVAGVIPASSNVVSLRA